MGYYYTTRWFEKAPATEGADGRIMMPCGVQAIVLEKRHIRPRAQQPTLLDEDGLGFENGGPRVLLDPQLYLAEISAETCPDVCANLVGYPWFNRVEPHEYDSGKFTQQEHKEQVLSK